MSDSPKRIEALSGKEKRHLLAQLLQKKVSKIKSLPSIVPQHVEHAPLSFSQQRIWLLDQLAPGSYIFNIPTSLRLRGILHVRALEQSLGEIMRRHQVLRTTFAIHNEQLVQVSSPFQGLRVPVVDLRSLMSSERETEALRIVGEEALRPFDLAWGPLLRITLLRLDEQEHVLLLTVHHIVFDGWSKGVFIRELETLYAAYTRNEPSPLPELPIQYTDFALWQRQWLQGDMLDPQMAYWKQKLSGAPTLLQLPTDRPRPAVLSFQGARQSFVLSPDLTRELKDLSQREGATLFMVLLAAFQILLSRYSGQEDIIVGSPIANRTRAEIEGLIGCFINTLVLRINLSGNPPFREFLGRIRETALDAYAHQDLPFERLVEELRPERGLSHNPLFQVMFVLQNAPQTPFELPNLTFSPIGTETDVKGFDITLFMAETEQKLAGDMDYNTDLFEATTIQRLVEHLQVLLKGIIAHPERRLADLPFLTDAERQHMLAGWSGPQLDHDARCIHERFETQVEQAPDAVAVVLGEQHVTYRELNQRANQTAHYLRKCGVAPGVLVGLCIERSLEMVIGLLGILKAGGAYVPMDPAYPGERLTFMLENVRVVLTRQDLLPRLTCNEIRVICLDADWETLALEDTMNPASRVTADNLVYVIYTSGSTGRPKGAGVYQSGLSNLLRWYITEFAITPQDSLLLVTSLSFDLTQKNIFAPLIIGGTLHMLASELYDPYVIVQTIFQSAITLLNCTPSAFYPLVEHVNYSDLCQLTSLRHLFLGGEPISVRRLWQWVKSSCCKAEIVNTYGPTECTDIVAFYRLTRPDQFLESPVPIGKPIYNMQLLVLDKHLQLVPIGAAGELCIAGISVGSGYINDVTLTATKFRANPFSTSPDARMYKTGDLVRQQPDGTLEFLGRIDTQVKLRGFRIELEEIEAALVGHPAVQACAALIYKGDTGEEFLAAYVVPAQQEEISTHELHRHLKSYLPEYMIPSSFAFLEALPLSPNGKVDRQALARIDARQAARVETFVAPRDPLEEALAQIWAEVLGLPQVSIYSNFFELGGHSLLAIQLVSKISIAMNQEVSIKLLFLHPDVASLASAIRALPSAGTTIASAPVERVSRLHFFPFTPFAHSPLFSLFESNAIAPVDAASLGYLPDALLWSTGFSHDALLHGWCQDLPLLASIIETTVGRVALLVLPRLRSDLYMNQQDITDTSIKAIEIAGKIGARIVSLGGLIPSATDYGRTLVKAMAGRTDLPRISTGHATTTATVVLTIRKALQLSGRDLAHERVGFLGLGSIGLATLHLMLTCLPQPREITLCDVYNNSERLEEIRLELIKRWSFRGEIHIATSQGEAPREMYDVTLMIGATNVADLLDITQVKPGTIIIDDSSPHCFSTEIAIQRLLRQKDILFTEGGVLRPPRPITTVQYMLRSAEQAVEDYQVEALPRQDESGIAGCVFSSLLSSSFEQLQPTVGLVDLTTCQQHYAMLNELAYSAPDPLCEDYVVPEELIHEFRQRFGRA